uniref:Uncharacterized protein n=1 Tax=Anguilla anguilla TaxID=7936 RepID=A0A0E9WAH6_ANGAN
MHFSCSHINHRYGLYLMFLSK